MSAKDKITHGGQRSGAYVSSYTQWTAQGDKVIQWSGRETIEICDCNTDPNWLDANGNPDAIDGSANSKLIANIPKLLEACKRAKRTITYLMSATPLSDITDQERQDYNFIASITKERAQ